MALVTLSSKAAWQEKAEEEPRFHRINEEQNLVIDGILRIRYGKLDSIWYEGREYDLEKSFDSNYYCIRVDGKIIYVYVETDSSGICAVYFEPVHNQRFPIYPEPIEPIVEETNTENILPTQLSLPFFSLEG